MRNQYSILCITLIFILQGLVAIGQVAITGTVKDGSNNPINGATLTLLSTGKHLTSTNSSGGFSINVPSGSIIAVKSIGHETSRFTVQSGKTVYNVVLEEVNNAIEETVVVGYQARDKKTLTGSAIVITADDIKDIPAANFTDLLQGKVAGLNIQLNNGTPGMRGNIALRGISNINIQGSGDQAFLTPTSPLFVIDGVPLDENNNFEYGFQTAGPGISPLSLIPVEDIESVTTLKDAQATALYGSRGAYGVILVTTKRGSSKIPIISYTSNFFVNTPPSLRQVIGGVEERRTRIQQIMRYDTTYASALRLINDSPMLADSLNAYYNNSTDWQSYFYRSTFNQTHNFNISGGDQQFNYKISPSYYNEKGIVENTGFTRYSLMMNMQYMPSTRFKMSGYMNGSLGKNSTGSGNAFGQSGVANSANTSSLLPPPSLFSGSIGALTALEMINENKTGNINSQVELQWEPIQGIRGTSTFSYNYVAATQDRFLPEALNANSNEIYSYNDRQNTLYNRNMVSYTKTLNGAHTISAYAFNELQIKHYRADVMQLTGTPSDQITSGLGYKPSAALGGTLDNLSEVRTLGYAGNASYNFMSKYILELTYRLDGSSTTGTSNPWAHLPSVGLRWNLKNEKFLENISWLDYLNLRGTWGKNIVPTGNIFDVYGRYVANPTTYNNQTSVSLNMNFIPNISLEPSVTTQLNGAIEIGLFNNLLSFTYENYYRQTDQILREKEISNINAFGNVKTNETSLVNMGHEFMVGIRPKFSNSDWSLNINLNGALNRDYAAALPDDVRQLLIEDNTIYKQSILYRLGINSLSNVLLHYNGVYKTDADVPINPNTGLRYRMGGVFSEEKFFRAGDPIWTDLNGDYILDEKDYVIVGNSQPVFTGGVNVFLQYKNWALNTQWYATIKRDIMNNALADRFKNYSNPVGQGALVPLSELNYWTPDHVDAYYPNPFDFRRFGFYDPFRYDQTLFQEDGSYLKFQTATLSYNFDRDYVRRLLGITSARLFLTANNIYTFSKYSGPDPELVSALGRDSSQGYPNRRSYTFGINVQF
ncbi:SusC/RagA family TonB-linked outer membrane protein [Sphingobacterium cellulitidis]|uniref:SusC/RagA family TonB-linked outer membrane protein n=1 Tax=Sphingobacterium cellulitidis TaxID=1768011 RepID=UPI00370D127C